jgi:hypothetical protein
MFFKDYMPTYEDQDDHLNAGWDNKRQYFITAARRNTLAKGLATWQRAMAPVSTGKGNLIYHRHINRVVSGYTAMVKDSQKHSLILGLEALAWSMPDRWPSIYAGELTYNREKLIEAVMEYIPRGLISMDNMELPLAYLGTFITETLFDEMDARNEKK